MNLDKSIKERQEFFEGLFVVTKTLMNSSKTKTILFKKEKEFIEDAFKDDGYIEELYYSACRFLESTIDFKKGN